MKRKLWIVGVCLILLLALTGCGNKSQKDVQKDLTDKIAEMKGYQMTGEMKLKTGTDEQKYKVEVWHQKPNLYRVSLTNDNQGQKQMILRNKEGVYVVTPALNKSYKFQSDWPNQSSQAYLYESLVKDIGKDKDAKFKITDEEYVFEVKTNYSNKDALPMQEIAFEKDSLEPEYVKIKNAEGNVVVSIEFDDVRMNPGLKEKDFDTEKNMTSMRMTEEEMTVSDQPISILYPLIQFEGVNLVEEKEITTGLGVRHILVYGGEKNFTLIEEKAEVADVAAVEIATGEPVDLGVSMGMLTNQMLVWTHNGIQFYLASTDLSQEEMVAVASSLTNAAMK